MVRLCISLDLNIHLSSFMFAMQGVAVPVTTVPLSGEDYEQLQLLIDPLAECDDHGIGLYQDTLRFLEEHTKA